MKDKLWWVLLGLAAILMLSNARAGEWNEKPVMCEQKEQFESLMVEQGKIILGGGDMFATVRTKNGLSDIPAVLPMRLYFNPSNKHFTIVEWHRDYNTYCILAYGEEWHILGQKS
jgi:hypothetical protein|tara:strand:- start:539 stop:883 length:345 start_codon:yes stop_codon:yes gene_type:complete